jgi:hypothetical protein
MHFATKTTPRLRPSIGTSFQRPSHRPASLKSRILASE